ncbi:tRNA pseudouridine(38-40) synthase TruA [Marivirga salinae]|uniref:tRNA pseudouridine synthase A n=1 Tax=Marivirga salinarum TaxID=3059078 RepID=A0AA49GEV9_9BACT|nr:tRNA pseudouridine(38-40) synthase TruA [Marivirga sp. BDSF4-3]WKK76913.2 tRNA pseudouridine(38-40) synthase TruA [Marivirga sp. BDSF4-3]
MRYFFTIAYKGTNYHGWQKQPNAIGVQQKVEDVFSTILNQKSEIVGSGRTDSGVHATAQVFQFDFSGEQKDAEQLLYKANKMLPKDVALKHVWQVKDEAHARFDATSRAYQYHIVTEKNPFAIDQAYIFTYDLAIDKMNLAAEKLLNYQDFESFSKVKTDVFTFNCDIFEAFWKQEQESLVFHIKANRFLRGMVRAIVGTLLDVGQNKISIEDFEDIIKAKDRNSAGRAVPANGLFLTEVQYPKDIYL